MSTTINDLADLKQKILLAIKLNSASGIADLAEKIGVSYEAIRQHIQHLEKDGYIFKKQMIESKVGAPKYHYLLTVSGEHLFPKYYDLLAVELIETLAEEFGIEKIKEILLKLTTARVQKWKPHIEGLPLKEQLHKLKNLYLEGDPYMTIEKSSDGFNLIEHNCPFMNVAGQHPILCSLTISTLTHLLGKKVVRKETFQNGDGKCVFHIMENEPLKTDALVLE